MATSYTRQSSFSDGDTITAALFNDEYNQLLNAFAYASSGTTGHRHDGTTAEGGNIHTIGDQDFLNKIVADSTNNRWGVFVQVSSSAVEQVRFQDGVISPVTDNDVDLGTSSLEFKDAYFDGTITTDTLTVDAAATIGTTLGVTGALTGASTIQGTTITATTAFVPDASDGAALGTSALEFSDLFLADGAVINFGDDQDVSLTHVVDTGLLLSSTDQLQFGDSGTYIYQSADGVLDLVSDTEIELTATTIDINGAVAMNGAITGGTNITISGELDAATLDISGNADIDGTTNLDAVDIDGAVQIDATVTVGVDDTGYDVKFFGDTASAYMLWDTSADDLILGGAARLVVPASGLVIGSTAVTTTAAELNAFSGITSTAAEINIIDGDTSASSTTLADADRVIVNDAGTMKQVALTDFETYFESAIDTFSTIDINGGSIDGATLGTNSAITQAVIDDIDLNGKVITMTGSSSDTAVFTAGTNGTLSIVTTDDAAAAANIQITADGTVDIDSAGVLTLDAGAAINIEPAAGSAILLDGTISVDAGVVTGATSITSTAFVGALTGNVTGNASGTAATVTTAAQSAITSLGTLTTLTVDDVAIDGKVVTMTGSSSDTAVFTTGTNGTLSIVTTDAAAAAANITITADGTFEADGTTITLDSAGDIILDTDGADVIFKDAGTTFGSATNTSGNLIIKSGTTTALTFSGANVTAAGTYTGGGLMTTGGSIVIPDAGNIGSASDTDAIAISSAGVVSLSATTEASAIGTAALTVAGGIGVTKDMWIGDDIVLDSDSAVIKLGADQDVTITHVADQGLNIKQVTDADDKALILTLQTGETDIVQNDYLGRIFFQAPDESSTGDAQLVGAEISALSEGTFSSTNNATSLVFATGASETAAQKMKLSSTGVLTLNGSSGSLIIPDAGNIGSASDVDAIAISSGGVVTMNQIPVFSAGINVSGGTIAGTLATAAQGNVTSLGTLTTLTVDNVIINGSTIGHTGDTDLITVASGIATVAGEVSMTTLDIGGTNVTSTAAELNILDGVTSTAAELNILDGVTSTAAELNILDGVTSTAAELNILDGVTSTAAELNILDGVTSTAAELNILDGVTSTTAQLNSISGQIGGRRNYILNGEMKVAQRGASDTGLGAASGYFTLDRWRFHSGGTAGELTMAQTADGPAGFANCIKLTTTTADTSIAAGEFTILTQRIEGQDVQQLQKGTATAKQVTVSFYVKGNASAVYVCELQDWDNGRTINQSFAVTTSWNRIELTFAADTSDPLDDDNANSLSLNFWLHAGSDYSSGTFVVNTWADYAQTTRYAVDDATSIFDATSRTFFITGVQMEIGTAATVFESRSYGEELALCQRYFYKGEDVVYGGFGADSAADYATVWFPTTMRADPTVTGVNSSSTAQGVSKNRIDCYRVGGYAFFDAGHSASADL